MVASDDTAFVRTDNSKVSPYIWIPFDSNMTLMLAWALQADAEMKILEEENNALKNQLLEAKNKLEKVKQQVKKLL